MKAAIVGAGFMGNIHADSLATIPDITLKWVVDHHKQRGQKVARKHHAKWVPGINPILEDAETEVVFHALPTPFRWEYLKQYMKAGKHILCEKPLTNNIREAERIRKAVSSYNKTFMVGQVVRFFWEYAQAHNMIKAGEIGKPAVARISRCAGPPASFDKTDNWYMDHKRSGGALVDLAVHDIDWLLWTFGTVKRAFGQVLNSGKKPPDYVLAVLKFKSGALAHLEASWIEAPGEFRTRFEVSGSKGLIEYDMKDISTLRLVNKEKAEGRKAGTTIPEAPSMESPYVSQLKHFAECIRKGKKPLAGVEEGCAAVRLALDILKSAQMGKPVEY